MTPADEPAPRRTALVQQPGRQRRFAIPPAQGALLVTVAIVGLAWALLVPPFQSPDETAHFAYAQSLATRLALPSTTPGRPQNSTDQQLADGAVRASSLAFYVQSVRPNWSAADFRAYLGQTRSHPSQSDGGGPNTIGVNPPLQYLYSDLAYWASGSANLFGRLYAMTAWGVVLLLATVVGAWLLAGEVFGPLRLGQLVAAAVAGLVPMETFMSTSINPDALMAALWTWALWLGARLIRRGWSTATAVALCGVTAGAILTKATSYALVPAALLALGLAWRREPAEARRALLARGAGALAALAVPVLAWVLYTRSHGRSAVNTVNAPIGNGPKAGFHIQGFISYIWQFYLPRLPFLSPFHTGGGPNLAVYQVWLKGGWGVFGWLDVFLPGWVYAVLGVVTAAVGFATAVLLRTVRRTNLALLAFLALALLALLFGLHLTAYRSLIGGQGPLLQGRYLLPVISLFGLAVAFVVLRMPRGWRSAAAGAVLAGLLLVQVVALCAVAKAYYT